MERINIKTILFFAIIIGFLFGVYNGYKESENPDRIEDFICENVQPQPALNDWKIRFQKDTIWYSYSVLNNTVGSINTTGEAKGAIINAKFIDENLKIAGISGSVTAGTIYFLKSNLANEILFSKTFGTLTKVKRTATLVLGIFSGYYIGRKIFNHDPSVESDEFVKLILNKDKWQKVIMRKVWKRWYDDAENTASFLKSSNLIDREKYDEIMGKIINIQEGKIENDYEYKITVGDVAEIIRARSIIYQKINSI